MSKVFLGGTCAETTWREELIPLLTIPYFNPVVEDWTEDCQAIEEIEKANACNIHFYYIDPKMQGFFSIAEAVESSNTADVKTVFAADMNEWTIQHIKSFDAIKQLLLRNGATVIYSKSIQEIADVVNNVAR